MSWELRPGVDHRVLVLAPVGRDATLTEAVLRRGGVAASTCTSLDDLVNAIEEGCGAVLVVEEAIPPGTGNRLYEYVRNQPDWSDLPVILLSRPGADSSVMSHAMASLGNVTVQERPIRVAALVSTVRTALRARVRQYQVHAALREREQAAEAAREADRRKDEFLAVLAHELRNPLAPIRNCLHILREKADKDGEGGEVCSMMERQVNYMVRLIDDLLEVSRITRGKIDLRCEPSDLAAVIRAGIEASQPLVEAGGHKLTVDMPADPVTVDADPVRLAQVVANLLNNAAKYTDRGGRITVSATREGPSAVIKVRDTGNGIAPDLLPRVFDMFTQGELQRGRAQGGLGIGLTLVKNIVEMHGGTVEAHSEGAGKGSEFVVCLAAMDVEPNAPRRRTPAGHALGPSLGSKCVMVVDDNTDAGESVGMLLRILGADARVYRSGVDALAEMDAWLPDAAIIDIGMPGIDGYKLARAIRARPGGDTVLLIALSGWGREKDRTRTRASGFDHHLVKPADIAELQSILSSVTEAHGCPPAADSTAPAALLT